MTKLTEGNPKEHRTVTAIKVLVIMMRSRHDRIPSSVRQFVTHSFGTDITDEHRLQRHTARNAYRPE